MIIQKWSVLFHMKIDTQIKKIHAKDIAFYHIPQLKKMADITDEHRAQCQQCGKNTAILDQLSDNLPDLFDGSIAGKKKYEEKFFAIEKHIMQDHGYRKNNYYTSVFTFWGMIVGAAIGYLAGILFLGGWIMQPILITSVLGLAGGRWYGYVRNNKLKENKLII